MNNVIFYVIACGLVDHRHVPPAVSFWEKPLESIGSSHNDDTVYMRVPYLMLCVCMQ